MVKAFSFVRRRPGLTREQFFERWREHTRRWDLRDHPECTLNRLVLTTENGSPYDGFAETHWKSQAALDEAVSFYATDAGKLHWADLQTFMDIDNSPTVTAVDEAEITQRDRIGTETLAG